MLTSEDCDLIIKKVLNTDDILIINFNLVESALKIYFYHGTKITSLEFFVEETPNLSEAYKVLDGTVVPKLYLTKENVHVFETLENFETQTHFLNVDQFKVVLETLARTHAVGVCHGNLHLKNILFRNKKGRPQECRLINFSFDYHGEPISDTLQVIFFNSSEDLRQQHLWSLLKYYYNCLEDLAGRKIFPQDQVGVALHEFLDKESLITKEECYKIIENKIGTTNYDLVSFETTPLTNVSGFLGEYCRLEIKICHLCENKTFRFFIKSSPKTGTPFEIAQNLQSFTREVFMYNTIVPQLPNYDECLPKCYFYRSEDLIIFEDMSLLNYENLDALKPLDFDLLCLVVKKLARFHACSLLLEEKISCCLVDRYREYFTEPLFFIDEKHLGARQFMTGLKSIPAAVDLFPEFDKDLFWKFWPQLQKLFYEVIKPSKQFRNVLSHGDLWTSNMLVKFENQKLVDCVFIDFQIVRYCPPAYDLLSVLHLTTDRSTRLKHEEDLIEIYYNELKAITKTYSREDLIGSIDYMRPQMLLQAAIDCVLTMCTPEEISSFLTNEEECRRVYFEDRQEFMTAMCQKSELYRKRLKECVLDIYDYCKKLNV